MTPADFPEVSAALLALRPRAKHNRQRERAEAAGLSFTWLALDDGVELLGVDHSSVGLAGELPSTRAVVALLPEELVPEHVEHDEVRLLFAIRFRVRPGHFRCRDCGWGDATDARGTHPGVCPPCASERTQGVRKAHLREGAE